MEEEGHGGVETLEREACLGYGNMMKLHGSFFPSPCARVRGRH